MESCAIDYLPPNAVVENKVKDMATITDVIKRAVERSGRLAKKVATTVSSSEVIVKIISVPAGLSERDPESHIELEAARHIPYPLEEASLDFEALHIHVPEILEPFKKVITQQIRSFD